MDGREFVLAFEESVPTTWRVTTGEYAGRASATARSPNGKWAIDLLAQPRGGGYTVDLYEEGANQYGDRRLVTGQAVGYSGGVPEAVRDLIEHATGGPFRNNRHKQGRAGAVDDRAGLFDDLGM
jgi:hypothetical protein